ncbi:MAG: 3-deoxy-manno-octulosonate cytidylyltransferase [Flavobacterium psychrophilum]
MKVIAVIPARYASTRFPAKLLQDLGGKTVIQRTYEAAVQTNLFDDVFVATDSELIYQEITSQGGKAVMSLHEHESGSDRIAEAIASMDVDIVVNVQGDEPFLDVVSLRNLIQVFQDDADKKVDLASLYFEIHDQEEIENPNNVKVVVDQAQFALYFSRSVIPYPRSVDSSMKYFQHIGIYAFRKEALLAFANLPMKSLEATEKLEQLRYLEYGKRIRMIETSHKSIGIDTPEDLEKAREFLRAN